MKRGPSVLGIAVLLHGIFFFALSCAFAAPEPALPSRLRVAESYGKLPLSFIANQGQTDAQVLYYLRGKGGTIYFTPQAIVFDLYARRNSPPIQFFPGKNSSVPQEMQRLSFVLKPVGAKDTVKVTAGRALPGKVNYLIGNDPSQWQGNIGTYREIVYEGIYENIDLKVYGTNQQMEYDFVVHPGGNPRDIRMAFEGVKGLQVDGAGNLLINTALGPLTHLRPAVYQAIKDTKVFVEGTYQVTGTTFTFALATYDPRYPLIIDPLTLSYSTYLGGTDADYAQDLAVDSAGNAYLCGYTSSDDFPTQSAYQPSGGSGNIDAFITKLDSSGTALAYSTYLGGSSNDYAYGIAIDSGGNAYITGGTNSGNFPTRTPYKATNSGQSDIFISKLGPSGNSLSYSTYLGGTNNDSGLGIAVDSIGIAYVTGYTSSTNFPTKNPYQATLRWGKDAFVTKLASSGNLLTYSTFLGGGYDDEGADIVVDASGNACLCGYTKSSDFPSHNGAQPGYGGGFCDGFITKVDSSGSTLAFSSFLGGTGEDLCTALAIDSDGGTYVTGQTNSQNLPTQNPLQPTYGGGTSDALVAKINVMGYDFDYASYLGGIQSDSGTSIAVDSSGNAYLAGHTASSNFPTNNPYQARFAGGQADAFLASVSSSGASLVDGTFLGGAGADYGMAIGLDSSGNVFLAGYTDSSAFPTLTPYQAALGGEQDAFISKFIYRSCVDPVADFSASPTAGQEPLTVQFTDQSTGTPTAWSWNFGDGGTSTSQNPAHTYSSAGSYSVSLTVTNACGSDSESKTNYVVVSEPCLAPVAAFVASPTSGLAPLSVTFTNQSTGTITSSLWDFGDGRTSATQNPIHLYSTDGTYTVALTVTNACGSDTETKFNLITATSASAPANLYFPHVASNSLWETEIAVLNQSATENLTGTLRPYGDAGTQVSTPLAVTLPPHGRTQTVVGTGFTNPTDIGYIIFEASSGNVSGYTKFYQNGIYRVAIPAVREINTSDLYVTHIASNQDWWTGLSLLNTTAQPVQLTIDLDNGGSVPLTLSPNQHYKNTIELLLGGQSQTDIHSAVIRGGNGVIGLELFGNTPTRPLRCLSGILLTDDVAGTLYYPHVVSNTNWWTGIVAYNPAALASTLTITPYSATGTALTTVNQVLDPSEKYLGTASALNLPADTAWLRISATSPITGFELIGSNDLNQLAEYSNPIPGSRQGLLAKLEKQGTTQVVLVNIESASATVTLTAYNDSGTQVATARISLGAFQKVSDQAQNFFAQDITNATFIGYTSDRTLVGYQLNASSDNALLDGLPGL